MAAVAARLTGTAAGNGAARCRPAVSRGGDGAAPSTRSVLLLRLLIAAADRGAEDVAERRAAVGAAVLRHRLLVLLDFLALDRELQLARGTVDAGDLGIHALTDREAIRPLVGLVAREFGAADE